MITRRLNKKSEHRHGYVILLIDTDNFQYKLCFSSEYPHCGNYIATDIVDYRKARDLVFTAEL